MIFKYFFNEYLELVFTEGDVLAQSASQHGDTWIQAQRFFDATLQIFQVEQVVHGNRAIRVTEDAVQLFAETILKKKNPIQIHFDDVKEILGDRARTRLFHSGFKLFISVYICLKLFQSGALLGDLLERGGRFR